MAQKRPSSPTPIQACKKKPAFGCVPWEKVNHVGSADNLQEILHTLVAKQVELVEQLVFRDAECQKLKKKFDEVDRNCRRWHEFAIGLQSRVKRLALILHRQQDSMKSLRNKSISSTNASTQTEPTSSQNNRCSNCQLLITDSKSKKLTVKKEEGCHAALSSSSLVIDLTDEKLTQTTVPMVNRTTSLDSGLIKKESLPGFAPQKSMILTGQTANHILENSAQRHLVLNGVLPHNDRGKPLAPVQPMGSGYVKTSVRQPHHATVFCPSDAKNNPGVFKSVNRFTKDCQAAQKNLNLSKVSPARNVANHNPYPPLPAMPLPPQNLPKYIPLPPSKPLLKVRKSKDGIELSWDHVCAGRHVEMDSYELFVYQHNPKGGGANRWKMIGNDSIKAMPLPMACNLSQFSTGSEYYFAVRGRDIYGRYGPFSTPCCSKDVHH